MLNHDRCRFLWADEYGPQPPTIENLYDVPYPVLSVIIDTHKRNGCATVEFEGGFLDDDWFVVDTIGRMLN
jgi:hypothetical protein